MSGLSLEKRVRALSGSPPKTSAEQRNRTEPNPSEKRKTWPWPSAIRPPLPLLLLRSSRTWFPWRPTRRCSGGAQRCVLHPVIGPQLRRASGGVGSSCQQVPQGTTTASRARRMDIGMSGALPKRTTRSGRRPGIPSQSANAGRTSATSIGMFRWACRIPRTVACRANRSKLRPTCIQPSRPSLSATNTARPAEDRSCLAYFLFSASFLNTLCGPTDLASAARARHEILPCCDTGTAGPWRL